jgi:CRP-like cAMP-binding protein
MSALKFRDVDAPPSIELLRELKKQEIDFVLSAARLRRFSSKSVMTKQGEPADQLFLLWTGRARYFFETANGKRVNLRWITPGHTFGEAALASPPSSYLVSTEAVRDSTALVWYSSTIRDLAQRLPQLLENIILSALDYLSWYVAAHAALTSQTARERLAHVVLGYAPSIGKEGIEGIELDVTNEELAHAANITPYTTSRLMSEWQKTGAIRKQRGKILLRSPKRLFLHIA